MEFLENEAFFEKYFEIVLKTIGNMKGIMQMDVHHRPVWIDSGNMYRLTVAHHPPPYVFHTFSHNHLVQTRVYDLLEQCHVIFSFSI